MSEHLLNRTQIGAAFKKVRGETVAQGVWRNITLDTRPRCQCLDNLEHTHPGDARSRARSQKHIVFLAGGDLTAGTVLKPLSESIGRNLSKRHKAFLVSLAGHRDETLVQKHFRQFEIQQFAHTQTATVERFHQSPVAHSLKRTGVNAGYHRVDLLHRQYLGQMQPQTRRLQQQRGIGVHISLQSQIPVERTYARKNPRGGPRRQPEIVQ